MTKTYPSREGRRIATDPCPRSHTKTHIIGHASECTGLITYLALQGEKCETKKYTSCNEQSLKDDHVVVKSSDHAEGECLHEGKECQETDVQRMAVALPVQQS